MHGLFAVLEQWRGKLLFQHSHGPSNNCKTLQKALAWTSRLGLRCVVEGSRIPCLEVVVSIASNSQQPLCVVLFKLWLDLIKNYHQDILSCVFNMWLELIRGWDSEYENMVQNTDHPASNMVLSHLHEYWCCRQQTWETMRISKSRWIKTHVVIIQVSWRCWNCTQLSSMPA